MKRIGIIYGSTTGNTESAAQLIQDILGEENSDLVRVEDASTADVEKYENLVFGTSTWGLGDIQDDFASFLPQLGSVGLAGKTVALFGLGDSSCYPDTFVDGMGELYEVIEAKGARLVGEVDAANYEFDASRAVVDGMFVGLPLDEENEGHLTQERLNAWLEAIRPEFR